MSKKKVLFINGHLNPGGCEKSLLDVLRHMDFSRYEVDLLLLEEMGAYATELPAEVNVYLYSLNDAFGPLGSVLFQAMRNGNVFPVKFRFLYMFSRRKNPRIWKKGKGLFRELCPFYDTIVAYRPGICTELAAYMFDAGQKISWWHHGEMLYGEAERKKLLEEYMFMNRIIAVSASSAEILSSYFPNQKSKISVIDNMIDREEILRKSMLSVEDIDVTAKNIYVSVGRFSPEKNMLLCVDIAKSLRRRLPDLDFKWYLIGAGEELCKVRDAISVNGLEENLIAIGKRENPYPYMSKAKFLIHPSLVESQGLTLLESMTLGIPVISVSSAGPKEYIQNGFNGILCEADAEAIAEQIMTYETDVEKYRSLCMHTACPEQYSVERVMARINQLLEN